MNRGYVVESGEWIYVAASSGIYRYKDGTEALEKFSDIKATYLNAYEDSIYCIANKLDESGGIISNEIVRISANGKETESIYGDQYIASMLFVYDGMIYYNNSYEDKEKGKDSLYRLSLDGKHRELLADNCGFLFTIYEENIYFQEVIREQENTTVQLIKMDMSGQNKQVIYDESPVISFVPIDEWVYFIGYNGLYFDADRSFQIKRIHHDGTGMERVDMFLSDSLNIQTDKLFCSSFSKHQQKDDCVLMQTDIKTLESRVLAKGAIHQICTAGNYIFYKKNDHDVDIVYIINFDGQELMQLT
jgi:hypothetical protein